MTAFIEAVDTKRDIPAIRPLRIRSLLPDSFKVLVAVSHKARILSMGNGVKINSQSSCENTLGALLPEIEDQIVDYTFRQDRTHVHRNNEILHFLMSKPLTLWEKT